MTPQNETPILSSGAARTWLDINLMIVLFQEDSVYFAYSPELDLNGYGKTAAEAKISFDVVLREYLDYTTSNGTLHEDLLKLGWQIATRPIPPSFDDLLKKNLDFAQRMALQPALTSESVRMPLFAK